ncbi:hypothetical protein HOG98_02930 [bacterium]|jgi:hypothetical protein|nr:hypothetical protein [bacterium]
MDSLSQKPQFNPHTNNDSPSKKKTNEEQTFDLKKKLSNFNPNGNKRENEILIKDCIIHALSLKMGPQFQAILSIKNVVKDDTYIDKLKATLKDEQNISSPKQQELPGPEATTHLNINIQAAPESSQQMTSQNTLSQSSSSINTPQPSKKFSQNTINILCKDYANLGTFKHDKTKGADLLEKLINNCTTTEDVHNVYETLTKAKDTAILESALVKGSPKKFQDLDQVHTARQSISKSLISNKVPEEKHLSLIKNSELPCDKTLRQDSEKAIAKEKVDIEKEEAEQKSKAIAKEQKLKAEKIAQINVIKDELSNLVKQSNNAIQTGSIKDYVDTRDSIQATCITLKKQTSSDDYNDILDDPNGPLKDFDFDLDEDGHILEFSKILLKENPISSLSKELFIKKLTNIFDLAPTPTSNLQKEIAKKALGLAIVQYDFLDEVNNLLNPSFISKFDLNDTISNAIDKRSKNLSNLPESKNIERANEKTNDELKNLSEQIQRFSRNEKLPKNLRTNYMNKFGESLLENIDSIIEARETEASTAKADIERAQEIKRIKWENVNKLLAENRHAISQANEASLSGSIEDMVDAQNAARRIEVALEEYLSPEELARITGSTHPSEQELRDIKGDPRPFKKITSMTERYSDIDFTFSEILLKENPFDSLSKEEFFKLFNLFLGQSQVGRLVTDPILPIEKNIAEKALSLAINHDFIEEIETIDSSLLEKFNLKSTLEDILTERGKLLSELPELRILERINDINHESLIKLAKQIESFAKNKALSSHLKINYLKNVGLPILKEIERVFNSRSKNNSQKIKELERQVYVIFDKKDMTSTAERERLSLRPIREKEILLKEGEGEKTVNTILDNIARLGYSKTT